jgi:carboxymethylenebutenolidase
MALNIDRAGADLRGSADYLLSRKEIVGKRVGTVGFCMGGQLALYAATAYPDRIGAAVDFYGVHPAVVVDASRCKTPILGHFGTKDTSVPAERIKALAAAINAAGGSFETHFYDADHAFFNDTRPQVYDPGAAALAWERSLQFFRKHLGQ